MNITTSSTIDDRIMPVLLVLFIGSGYSALIHEIVWFGLLRHPLKVYGFLELGIGKRTGSSRSLPWSRILRSHLRGFQGYGSG